MTLSETLRIMAVRYYSIRNPESYFSNSLVVSIHRNSENLKLAIETVEEELSVQETNLEEVTEIVNTEARVNESYFDTLPSPSIESLTQRSD